MDYKKFKRTYRLSKVSGVNIFDNDNYNNSYGKYYEVINYLIKIADKGYIRKRSLGLIDSDNSSIIYDFMYNGSFLYSYFYFNNKIQIELKDKFIRGFYDKFREVITISDRFYLHNFITAFMKDFIDYKQKEKKYDKL